MTATQPVPSTESPKAMKTYFAVVDKEPDSASGMWFPDVTGCFSAADDEADIMKNAIEALLLHLEDQAQPAARQVHEVARHPEVAEALARGAYLLAVLLVTARAGRCASLTT